MLAYRKEWMQSLEESHRDSASRAALLADFAVKADTMRQALAALDVGDTADIQDAAAGGYRTLAKTLWF